MKKTYVKPQVYFEDFQLSASIAAGCTPGYIVGHSEMTCSWDDGVGTIFENTSCTYTPDQAGNVCYGVPLDTNRLFAS